MANLAEKKAARSKAAYTLVDVSGLPDDVRKAIVEDASVGGGEYGVRIVEEYINGSSRTVNYGVYDFDAEKWAAAKDELGISAEEVEDEALHPGPDPDGGADEEAALRLRAQEEANRLAEEARTADAERLREITHEDPPEPVAQEGMKGTSAKSTTNKAPR